MNGRRILLATDAWQPQVNGVVRTWETSIALLQQQGYTFGVIEPRDFLTVAAPKYPEIRLAFPSRRRIAQMIHAFQPDAIHIATEGPIGLAVRAFCVRQRWNFTTSYHSKFPEFLEHLTRIPARWTYRVMRWFHAASSAVMVAQPSLERELAVHGIGRLKRWSRGVDLQLFRPRPKTFPYPKPIMLYAGRISKEKNLESFLALDLPGTKVLVGDGPIRASLQRDYPSAIFLGYRKGEALAEAYANADVFVFPSRTDTFGLVMIEALACGAPVAAYPVVGPIDIITRPDIGALHDNLREAILLALQNGRPEACVEHARTFTWERCTAQLASNFVAIQ